MWGSDKNGQLGQNINKKLFLTPRVCAFQGAERVAQVSCGDQHSMILTAEGLLYAFGNNSGKQLGLRNAQAEVKTPTLVEDLFQPSSANRVSMVSCGSSYTLAVTTIGQVYSWGTNLYGALAQGNQNHCLPRPTLIMSFAHQSIQIARVSANFNHTLFLGWDSLVYGVGKFDNGQLGVHPSDISSHSDFYSIFEPICIPLDYQVTNVQAGRDFSLFLTASQEVLSCGANSKGQLGLGDTSDSYFTPTKIPVLKNVVQIQAYEGSVALNSNGEMFVWGPVNKDKCVIMP